MMSIFGQRLEIIMNETGLTQRGLASLLGFTESALSNWRRRPKDPDYRTLLHVADVLELSMDWLAGRTEYPRWSPRLMHARERLLWDALEEQWLQEVSPARRFAWTWERLHELLPNFREEVWATYLRWSITDWHQCKSGNLQPGWAQFEGAEMLTGLPGRWFWDGDVSSLRPLSEKSLERLGRILRSLNMTPEDVIRLVQKATNPRV